MTDEKIETCGMMVPAGLVELKDQRSISHVAVYLKAGICKTIKFGLPFNVKCKILPLEIHQMCLFVIFIRFYDIMGLWETDTNHDRE